MVIPVSRKTDSRRKIKAFINSGFTQALLIPAKNIKTYKVKTKVKGREYEVEHAQLNVYIPKSFRDCDYFLIIPVKKGQIRCEDKIYVITLESSKSP